MQPTPPRRLLVPVDRSACSEAAVDTALALAEIFGGPVTLLHAWEPLYELGVVMGAATVATADGKIPLTQHIADEARRTLEEHRGRVSDRLATDGSDTVEVIARLVEGPPKKAIHDAAASGDYDLVVMGTHGRTGMSHVMLGSIAEWVVRTSPIPVMTVRRDADDAS